MLSLVRVGNKWEINLSRFGHRIKSPTIPWHYRDDAEVKTWHLSPTIPCPMGAEVTNDWCINTGTNYCWYRKNTFLWGEKTDLGEFWPVTPVLSLNSYRTGHNAPVICNHCPPPPPYGDRQGIAGLMCGAVTFQVPSQCRACDITQISPNGIYFKKVGLWFAAGPHSAGLLSGLWWMKSHCPCYFP